MAETEVILVRGTARRQVAADHAVLHLTVTAMGVQAVDVERALGESAAAVDRVLEAHGAAIRSTVATSISIRPNTYWSPETGRQVRDGFVGERTVKVRLDDPDAAGALIRLALDVVAVEVAGPSWHIADDHPVHAEVRAAAAADARSCAEAYAAGLGVAVGSVAFVAEPGLRSGDHGGAPLPVVRMAAHAEDAGAAASGPIALPGDLEVTAAVDVAFHLQR